jgi:hypothetical protein
MLTGACQWKPFQSHWGPAHTWYPVMVLPDYYFHPIYALISNVATSFQILWFSQADFPLSLLMWYPYIWEKCIHKRWVSFAFAERNALWHNGWKPEEVAVANQQLVNTQVIAIQGLVKNDDNIVFFCVFHSKTV